MVFGSLFGRGDCDCIGYGPYPSSVEVDCGCIASVALLLREEFGTPLVDWKSFTVVKAGM